MSQVELAERLNVSQNRVSRIEHGDIERAQLDTLRKYVEAVAANCASRCPLVTSASHCVRIGRYGAHAA